MAWIETEAGEHVNLATAQCIGTSDGGSYFVVDRGVKSHKLPKYLDELSYLLAPAVPGSGVLHCIHYDPAPGPGEPDSCWVETHPIVAWRVTGDTALPVAPGIKLPGWGSG